MDTDDLVDLAITLRSSLSSTELVLAKFSEAFRRQLTIESSQSPTVESIVANALGVQLITTAQADFGKFKSTMDMVLARFPK